jgi:hypothetical protein
LGVQILPEEGSPVAVNSVRAEADLDPFGVPTDIRTYADYKNVSSKPVVGVKFRIRYIDSEGKDRGTFHAPHACSIAPGMTATEKWKRDKVDPRVVGMMIRVMAVKFSDGSLWESSKVSNIVKPSGDGPGPGAGAPAETMQPEPGEGGGADPFGGASE